MDFTLPDGAEAVRQGVAAVCARYDMDYWQRCEAEKRWPEEVWADLAEGGWLGLAVPEEYGGGGQGLLELAVATETLAASGAAGGSAFTYVLTPGFGALTVARHGSAAQRAALLPGMASGEVETCFALTEPDAGSNSLAISTFARRDGGEFVINGQKVWITGVQRAAWMLLVARTVPAAEARPRTHGLTVFLVNVPDAVARGRLTYRPIPKMGANTTPSNMVFLDDLRVPERDVLGEVDQGAAVLWDILNPERILLGASALGGAEVALRVAVSYAKEREVFGRPIGANQAIAFPLARVKAQIELARLMLHKAAWLFDRGRPCATEANIAKLAASQAAWEAADHAFQTHGGMAFSLEYPVARLLADARIGKVAPVTEELLLNYLATQVLGLPRGF
ncbi:acyl-CoA dehydrogenase [Sphaerisporangium krabiense]|uniref:Acyl-CoA dehydrogenase n=1 Tax=Sphaerisporangium krabiense TaxID=763782 RepID=A0A7W9DU54_9ACTN|nr:acyl-CoA dehydrogenase family protein [Sphaerisporangium krabiense]MBB5631328.1 acyl-CoA dehydrogenase [Sphaerisporangium krabiense]GII60745.1 acyl-CoA dehydrogenase [Sphaerisporangium krabiense]